MPSTAGIAENGDHELAARRRSRRTPTRRCRRRAARAPRIGERRPAGAVAAPAGEHGDDVLARGDPGRYDGGEAARRAARSRRCRRGAATARRTGRTRCRRTAARPAAPPRPHRCRARRRAPRPTEPSTTPPARTTRRACRGVPPVAAISARFRDCRRAPTANAGPASSTTSISAITTTSSGHGDTSSLPCRRRTGSPRGAPSPAAGRA